MAEVSFEDFMGGKADKPADATSVSYEDFSGKKEEGPHAAYVDKTLNALKAVGGEGAALADMVLGIPGFLINYGAKLGGAIYSSMPERGREDLGGSKRRVDEGKRLSTISPSNVGNQANIVSSTPLKGLLDMFKSGEAYEHAKTTQGMEKLSSAIDSAGTWVENATGGRVSRDAVPMLAETLMVGATGIGSGKKVAIDPATVKRMREQQAQIRAQAESDAKANTLTPEEFMARVPVQGQINSMLGIKSPAERAQETRAKRRDVASAFREPEKGGDYGSIDESIFRADERMRNEADFAEAGRDKTQATPYEVGSVGRQPYSQAEVLRIMQKPGYERTAEDLITLREARKQEGSQLPKGTAALTAAGVTGTLALQDDDLRSVAAGLVDQLGAPAAGLTAMFLPAMKGSHGVKAAEKLKESGASRKEIWEKTGLFQGPEGVWRHEISDTGAGLVAGLERNPYDKELLSPVSMFKPKKLGELIDHPELYRNFPELKDADVKSTGFNFGLKGGFDEKSNTFYLGGGKAADVRSTLLHEIQHYVQGKGGMARGGSSEQFLAPDVAEMRKELNDQWREYRDNGWKDVNEYTFGQAVEKEKKGEKLYDFEKEELQKARGLRDFHGAAQLILRRRALDKLENYAYKQYMRLAGEVEARTVQKRQDMTPEERRATPPWESYDLPEESFITRMTVGRAGAQAVKGPGGMWHPEAVERLADPLKDALVHDAFRRLQEERAGGALDRNEFDAALKEGPIGKMQAWADKAIRNYLNKYAGTERDPLKDVEIPFGEGTKRWEDIMDLSISKRKEMGPKGEEDVFRVGPMTSDQVHARGDIGAGMSLQSYLSHVGDYLRQNVKPEELPRYDLVRAVRETAENDKRVAKQMEKAQSDSTKTLPVYKTYPDGFKWVELKLPEKLTEEQRKQVRPANKQEGQKLLESDPNYIEGEWADGKYQGFVAIGADGKPIKNTYTGEIAGAPTPEEAWLAGRLAEEGNSMGHCVGGYCAGVASGESRIFSLRDPKGKSHVTVEVEPQARIRWELVGDKIKNAMLDKFDNTAASIAEERRFTLGDFLQEYHPDIWEKVKPVGKPTEDILQIKGKQNRAPNAEYLPYVQDFVRSGKWGEVGDLGNTGLVELSKSLQDRYQTQSRYVTRHEADVAETKFNEARAVRGPRNQQGQVSQELIVGLAGLGLGGIAGWAMSDDPSGALLGALAGGSLALPGVRNRIKSAVEIADYGLGALSTRIGNLSEPLKLRTREYERRVLAQSYDILHKVVPFMQELNKLGDGRKKELERAILTNDPAKISELMKGNVPLVAAWRETRNVLSDLGEKLQGHGRFKTLLDDYFPRLVKDVEGLKSALNLPERTRLEQALMQADKTAIKNRGTPLTSVEQSAIINREIQGFRRAKGYQPGYAKQRGVDEITARLQPFYHTPSESLYTYIRGAVQDLEMAKFFGRDLVQTEIGSQKHTNIEGSIGNLVGREMQSGKLTPKQADQLIGMLQSRFQSGERSPNKLVQEVRNLGNMGLLGNVVSAVTQMSDTAMSIYAQDLRSTITAVARQISGREKITARDFGLADHVAEEFVSTTKTADWLNKMFKYSGFSAIDRFGKTTLLNAAHARASRLARTPGGVEQLRSEYGASFGAEFPSLVSDLKEGRMSERVRAYLFSELADMQPISKSEMPQAYLDHPNGRLIYMLKTFMLKQMDVIRRDTYNEIKKGNVGKGLKNLTEYGLILGIAGATTQMVQDWIMGRDVHFTAGDVLENALKTFGWSEYVRDKAAKGRPAEAIAGMVVPPYRIMDEIIRRDPRAVQYIPLVGKLYYSWELGGKEAAEIARKKKTGEELSDEAKEYRKQRRERAKARREE